MLVLSYRLRALHKLMALFAPFRVSVQCGFVGGVKSLADGHIQSWSCTMSHADRWEDDRYLAIFYIEVPKINYSLLWLMCVEVKLALVADPHTSFSVNDIIIGIYP